MVVVINYDPIEELPPVMSLLINLKILGEEVYYIGMASTAGRVFLEGNQIPHDFLPPSSRRSSSRILDYFYRYSGEVS